jgi:hypothetical protein
VSRLGVAAADGNHRPTILDTMKAPLRTLRGDYRTLTGPLRGLPSVLIIGAQKAGTTSLFNYLVGHEAEARRLFRALQPRALSLARRGVRLDMTEPGPVAFIPPTFRGGSRTFE